MTPQYIGSMISAIIPALEPLVTVVETASETPANVTTDINTAMNGIETLAAGLAAAPTVAATEPVLLQIQSYAQAILTAAAGVKIPYPESLYLQIASGVVMMMFSSVETVITAQSTVASTHHA